MGGKKKEFRIKRATKEGVLQFPLGSSVLTTVVRKGRPSAMKKRPETRQERLLIAIKESEFPGKKKTKVPLRKG